MMLAITILAAVALILAIIALFPPGEKYPLLAVAVLLLAICQLVVSVR